MPGVSGFGENCRVLEWVLRRCDDEDVADVTPVGYIPKLDPLTLTTLSKARHGEAV